MVKQKSSVPCIIDSIVHGKDFPPLFIVTLILIIFYRNITGLSDKPSWLAATTNHENLNPANPVGL
jgi:hypothetical protein